MSSAASEKTPRKELTLFVLADASFEAETLAAPLRKCGYVPQWKRIDSAALRACSPASGREIIVVVAGSRVDVAEALSIAREAAALVPFVVVEAESGRDVEWIRAGADDCLRKGDVASLPAAIERALRLAETRRALRLSDGYFRDVFASAPAGDAPEAQQRVLLADRLASVGMLAAGVAHEINNPLAYVQSNLDFAIEEISAKELGAIALTRVRAALTDAREGASRVHAIAQDLKTFARPDDRRTKVIDLRPVLESALRVSFREIRERARVVKEYGPVPLVRAVPARLGQVFLNLLINAAHAVPDGAAEQNAVHVSTSTDQRGHAVVTVRDTGSGMTAAVMRQIFDPFFTTKPSGRGTGLGLTICQGIVASLGGEIQVQSAPGQGSTFRVILPSAPFGAEAAAKAPARRSDARRGSVLLVDDDTLFGRAIARVLSAHDFTFSSSGREAVEMVARGARFDVILLDVMMPETSGTAAYEEFMRIDPAQAARVVFLTGGVLTAAAQRFLEEVPNLRVQKPFDAGELRALVRKLMG